MFNETHVTIDLAALQHNASIAKRSASGSKVMAMIKADAYGHGLLPVAKALQHVDGFAVARLSEALVLREAGFNKTILVLTGFSCAEELECFVLHDLDAVVHSEYQVSRLTQSSLQSPLSVWLKINTGMNRLGVNSPDVMRISDALQLSGNVRLPFKLMTHLACADDMNRTVTEEQIELFDESVKGLAGEQSIANSAGLLGWQYSQRHWVRPGIMLYGGCPFAGKPAADYDLKPVMTLKSSVISLRTVSKGDCVGYGGSWTAQRTSLIATVGIGYGDGYPRHAVTGTPVLIGGQKAPLVGRVSMDSISIDVSQCEGVAVGDVATLWGDGLPIDEIAEKSDAISYELMCGITERVTRIVKGLSDGE
ncbi:MAG: alanine racemase [Cycloclasticus sp. symbiont of Bathymodiolus heckerae]|nr:MAG: alanine racemase [Cycloclasticus sp. symbiont of Bathymodiolus heckerae]